MKKTIINTLLELKRQINELKDNAEPPTSDRNAWELVEPQKNNKSWFPKMYEFKQETTDLILRYARVSTYFGKAQSAPYKAYGNLLEPEGYMEIDFLNAIGKFIQDSKDFLLPKWVWEKIKKIEGIE